MAASISKKELKDPDILQVEFSKLVAFIGHHKAKVYVILAAFLLCLVIAAGWFLYRLNYEKSALNIYTQVEAISQKNVGSDSVPKLIEGYRNLIAQYPRSKSALYAHYQLASLYYGTNQLDLSLQAYDEFLRKAPQGNDLRIFAHLGQGYCYEAKKDLKKALAAFESALKSPRASNFEGQIYRDMGRIYEEMKDPKKALEYYKLSLEKTTDDAVKAILKRKIATSTVEK